MSILKPFNKTQVNPFGAEYFEVSLQSVLSMVTKVDSRAERINSTSHHITVSLIVYIMSLKFDEVTDSQRIFS